MNNTLQSSRFYDTVSDPALPRLLRIRDVSMTPTTTATMLNDAIIGLPLGHERNNGTITNMFYLEDRVNTVKQVYESTTATSRPIQRDAWGVVSGSNYSSIGFTGEWTDTNTNVVFLHARWYNPSSGTFISRDPFAGYPTQRVPFG